MARAKTKKDGIERRASIPATTRLKLFVYPGKDGLISCYATRYCVGFEMETTHVPTAEQLKHEADMGFGPSPGPRTFVSQQYITAWTEDYAEAVRQFESLRDSLDCVEAPARKRRVAA